MKRIVKKLYNKKLMEMISRELKIMYMLDHENITKLYTHFEDLKHVYLIMELIEGVFLFLIFFILKGDLFKKLYRVNKKAFTPEVAKRYFI